MREIEVSPADLRWIGGANALRLRDLVEVVSGLHREGIAPVLLKGAALLATVYAADPERRPMNDLDLLVAPRELPRAGAVLSGLGYCLDPSRGWEFRRGRILVDLQADLWHLDRRRAGSFRRRALAADLGGVSVRVPDATDHYLLILLHAAVRHAERRPQWREDLARLSRVGTDWRAVLAGVRRVRAGLPVALWLDAAGPPVPPAFRRALAGTHPRGPLAAFYRRLLARAPRPDACELATHLLHLPRERRFEGLARYVLPDAATLRRRYGSGRPAALRARRLLDLARRTAALI